MCSVMRPQHTYPRQAHLPFHFIPDATARLFVLYTQAMASTIQWDRPVSMYTGQTPCAKGSKGGKRRASSTRGRSMQNPSESSATAELSERGSGTTLSLTQSSQQWADTLSFARYSISWEHSANRGKQTNSNSNVIETMLIDLNRPLEGERSPTSGHKATAASSLPLAVSQDDIELSH